MSGTTSAPPSQAPLVENASKGISLLYGILIFLTIFGLTEIIRMLTSGTRAGLIELLIFALLAVEAIVLLITIQEKIGRRAGFFGYLSVWVLGIIPYFIWGALYWMGKGIAGAIQRQRGNALLIGLFVFVGITILCVSVYFLSSEPPRLNAAQ